MTKFVMFVLAVSKMILIINIAFEGINFLKVLLIIALLTAMYLLAKLDVLSGRRPRRRSRECRDAVQRVDSLATASTQSPIIIFLEPANPSDGSIICGSSSRPVATPQRQFAIVAQTEQNGSFVPTQRLLRG